MGAPLKLSTFIIVTALCIQGFAKSKDKRHDSVECDIKKQQYGTVLECGEDLFSVKQGSAVEKSIFQICKTNFRCKISFETNPRDEVTKILSAFSKGKKQAQTFDTSFDCKKAKGFAEETVCTNQDLAKLDNQLGAQIKISLEKSSETKKIRDEQKAWIKNIRDKCENKECLIDAYKTRLESFDNEIEQ